MTSRFSAALHPFASARPGLGRFAGFGRIVRRSFDAVAGGMRLLRTAPPLGDVGTRGNELTAWVEAWNRRGNPHDFNRE